MTFWFNLLPMENVKEEQEIFEVLGLKLRLKKDEMSQGVTPQEIVDLVQSEAMAILNKTQKINLNQAAVLAALKIAQDKIALEKEYQRNVSYLKHTALDALQLIEEVIPESSN